jgi:hypothetical protein
VARRQIEFLQKKSQAISRWVALARVAHSSLASFSPRNSMRLVLPYGRFSNFRTDALTGNSYAAELAFQGPSAKSQRGEYRPMRLSARLPTARVCDGVAPRR